MCSVSALSIMSLRKKGVYALPVVLSVIGLITGFIALSLTSPRNTTQLGIDYLGFIVAILAIFATLLLGMQLYNVFRLKEDADQVKEAKKQIDGYAAKVENLIPQIKTLEEMIQDLEKQTKSLKEDNDILTDVASDLLKKSAHAVYIDTNDGPDDDK